MYFRIISVYNTHFKFIEGIYKFMSNRLKRITAGINAVMLLICMVFSNAGITFVRAATQTMYANITIYDESGTELDNIHEFNVDTTSSSYSLYISDYIDISNYMQIQYDYSEFGKVTKSVPGFVDSSGSSIEWVRAFSNESEALSYDLYLKQNYRVYEESVFIPAVNEAYSDNYTFRTDYNNTLYEQYYKDKYAYDNRNCPGNVNALIQFFYNWIKNERKQN